MILHFIFFACFYIYWSKPTNSSIIFANFLKLIQARDYNFRKGIDIVKDNEPEHH